MEACHVYTLLKTTLHPKSAVFVGHRPTQSFKEEKAQWTLHREIKMTSCFMTAGKTSASWGLMYWILKTVKIYEILQVVKPIKSDIRETTLWNSNNP